VSEIDHIGAAAAIQISLAGGIIEIAALPSDDPRVGPSEPAIQDGRVGVAVGVHR